VVKGKPLKDKWNPDRAAIWIPLFWVTRPELAAVIANEYDDGVLEKVLRF
jgi:hypothetical protein